MEYYAKILVQKAIESNPQDVKQGVKELVYSMNFSCGSKEFRFLELCYENI